MNKEYVSPNIAATVVGVRRMNCGRIHSHDFLKRPSVRCQHIDALSLGRGINAKRSFADVAMRKLSPCKIFGWTNRLELMMQITKT